MGTVCHGEGTSLGGRESPGQSDPGRQRQHLSPHPTTEPGRAGACRPMAAPPRMSQPRGAAEAAPGAAQSGAEGAEDAAGGGCRQPRSRPPSRSRAGGIPAAPRPLSPGPAMGALTSRQNAGVEEVDVPANSVYRYPPKSGEPPGGPASLGEGKRGASRAPGGGDPAHPKANADAQGGTLKLWVWCGYPA